jgi:DNA-binding transcriptional LysR family regulator
MRHSLRQLEVFLAIARVESVSQAAQALGMSQSAASGSLLDFERQFSVQLFERTGKRLKLNEFGRSIRPRAEAVLEHASDLERALESRNDGGPLRVGATMTIGNYLAVPLLARFMRQYPGTTPTLVVANTEEIARQVANFELDVALIEGEVEHPELELSPWRDDDLVVFCGPHDKWAKKRALTDDDLRDASWIVRERGSGTRQAFDRAMRGLLPDLRIALTLQQTEAIKSAVEGGLGVGCVSRIALEAAFKNGTLRPCRVPHRDFRRQFFFLLHKGKRKSQGVTRWLDLCRAAAG